jgi:hypothetical protein
LVWAQAGHMTASDRGAARQLSLSYSASDFAAPGNI